MTAPHPADDLRCIVHHQRCRDRRVLREDGGFDWLPCSDLGEPWVCPPCALYRRLCVGSMMSERKARAVGVLVDAITDQIAHDMPADESWSLLCVWLDAIAELLRR